MFHFLFAYASSPLSCSLLLWTVGPNSWNPPPTSWSLLPLRACRRTKAKPWKEIWPFCFYRTFYKYEDMVACFENQRSGLWVFKYHIFIIFDNSFWFDYHQLGSQPVNGTQLYFNSRKRYLVDLYYFSLLFVWAALSSWAVLVFWGILLHKGYQLLEVTEGKKNSVIQIKSSQKNNCSQQEKVYF